MQEIVTREIPNDDVRRELERVIRWIAGEGFAQCQITLGWGCRLPASELWQPATLPLAEALGCFDQAVASGTIVPGASDFWLASDDRQIEVLFCHEGDIHLKAAPEAIATRALSEWSEAGLLPR